MTTTSRRLLSAVVILSLSSGVRVAAQAKGPLKEIPVDLRAAILNDTLPFDVPFIVTATIGEAVTEVQAWIVEVPKTTPNNAQNPIVCPPTGDPTWRAIRPWRDPPPLALVPLADPSAPAAARTFRLLFPALEANRFYCVRFELGPPVPLTAEQLAAFRNEVIGIVDVPIRNYANQATVPTNETLQLREALLAALRSITGAQRPRPKPGSVFDPALAAANVRNRMVKLLGGVVNVQSSRLSGVEALTLQEPQLVASSALVERRSASVLAVAPSRLKAAPEQERGLVEWFARRNQLTVAVQEGLRLAREAWTTAAIDDVSGRFELAINENQKGQELMQAILKPLTPGSADHSLVNDAITALGAELNNLKVVQAGVQNLRPLLEQRQTELENVAKEFETFVRTEIELVTTSIGTFDTRHGWYVSMDIGLAYGWDVNEAFGYAGTNIYFRPVNKDAPLQSFGNFAQSFTRRVSALIGLTFSGQIEEQGRREDLIGGRILVVGGGVRLTDSIRANGGALVFKAADPNPLVTERRVEVSPFVSLSFDIDIVGTLGELGSAFGVPAQSKPNAAIR